MPPRSSPGAVSSRIRPPATRSRTVPSRSVRTSRGHHAERAQRRRGRMPVRVALADLDRGDLAARSARACAGRPASALPWCATLSASTRGRSSAAVTSDSASAGSSRSNAPSCTCATTARSFGSPSGRHPRGGAGGHSTRKRNEPTRSDLARARGSRRPAGARERRGQPALDRRRPARAAVEHEPRAVRGDHRQRHALVVGLGMGEHQHVEPLDARVGEAAQDRPAGRPGVDEHRARRRAAAASRLPDRRRGTSPTSSPPGAAARRAAARRRRPRPRHPP